MRKSRPAGGRGWGLVALATLLGPLVQTGCTTTAGQREDREYRRLLHERKFLAFKDDCERRGRRVYIDASSAVGSDGIPGRWDRYFCS